MKLLRVSFDNLRMFEGGKLQLDFFAQDKVFAGDESVTLLEKPIYKNNVVAIAGINASGKSIALSLVDLALRVIEGRPVGLKGSERGLAEAFSGNTNLSALLWIEGKLYFLKSNLIAQSDFQNTDTLTGEFSFGEEVLRKIESKTITKAVLSANENDLVSIGDEIMRRSSLDANQKRFLQKDVSIASAYVDGTSTHLYLEAADSPLVLQQGFDGLDEVLRAFDSSIEHLTVEDEGRAYQLKLKTCERPLTLSREGLEDVLSSGTAKGLVVVQRAIMILRAGGFLLLDEIENHLNRQLVNVIIDLFASTETNPHGATLLLTTHYPEVLDHLRRKDNVYFFARGANALTSVVKYSSKVKRIENKKSEVFVSNFVRGTAPRFAEVTALREFAKSAVGAPNAN